MSTMIVHGVRFRNVHSKKACKGKPCMMHNPVSTHMDDWPVVFRLDRFLFERLCPCGVGHPDPSQFDHWEATGLGWQVVHGCCGCCHPNPDYRPGGSRLA